LTKRQGKVKKKAGRRKAGTNLENTIKAKKSKEKEKKKGNSQSPFPQKGQTLEERKEVFKGRTKRKPSSITPGAKSGLREEEKLVYL